MANAVRAVQRPAELVSRSIRSMGSTVRIQVVADRDDPSGLAMIESAFASFRAFDAACTRFDPASDLMRVNRAGAQWCSTTELCFAALQEAAAAYDATDGRFDPRVLRDLTRLGYDHSRRFGPMSPRGAQALVPRRALPRWEPRFRRETTEVLVGRRPIDLGGIGKGLAVRAAAQQLAGVEVGFLVEAGGDCWCGGRAPDGGPWRIAVEDPAGGADPVAVLALTDLGVATSSTRVCSWLVGGSAVHHLIDPTTGLPGGAGLAAVTVVARDTAVAEVWSKALFLAGLRGVRREAEQRRIAAMWVDDRGELECTDEIAPMVIWRAR